MIYTYEQKQEIKELEEKKKEAKQKLIETNEDNYLSIMNECHYKINIGLTIGIIVGILVLIVAIFYHHSIHHIENN